MRALVVDDEPQIRRALKAGLERNGYSVSAAASGEEALDMAAIQLPDVIILDLAMPGLDGIEVCRQLRGWTQVPVIVLSVRDSEKDKIAALDIGADDYLTKPFSLEELLARLRAVLRRARPATDPEPSVVTAGELTVDLARRRVTLGEEEVHLTPIEYELLRFMVLHPDRVLTHRQLLTRVWGPAYGEDVHTLRVHIANLRNKIEREPARPRLLHTEPRIGYRFRADD